MMWTHVRVQDAEVEGRHEGLMASVKTDWTKTDLRVRVGDQGSKLHQRNSEPHSACGFRRGPFARALHGEHGQWHAWWRPQSTCIVASIPDNPAAVCAHLDWQCTNSTASVRCAPWPQGRKLTTSRAEALVQAALPVPPASRMARITERAVPLAVTRRPV